MNSFYVVFKVNDTMLNEAISNGNHQAHMLVVNAALYGQIVALPNCDITEYMIKCVEKFDNSYTTPNYCNHSTDCIKSLIVETSIYADANDIQW